MKFIFDFLITFYAQFLMKFIHKYHETPLYIAVDKGNIEIVKLLLSCEKIDINALNKIFNLIYFISLQLTYLTQFHMKIFLISFQFLYFYFWHNIKNIVISIFILELHFNCSFSNEISYFVINEITYFSYL